MKIFKENSLVLINNIHYIIVELRYFDSKKTEFRSYHCFNLKENTFEDSFYHYGIQIIKLSKLRKLTATEYYNFVHYVDGWQEDDLLHLKLNCLIQ